MAKLKYTDLQGNIVYVDKLGELQPPVQKVVLYQEFGDDEDGTISQKVLTDKFNELELIEYFTKEQADELYQPKGDYLTEHQSLEDYAKLIDIPSLDGYAKLEDIPTIPTDYAKIEDIPSLDGYAKLTDIPKIPSLDDYAKLEDIPTVPSLDDYAKLEDIPTKVSVFTNDKGYVDVNDIDDIINARLGNEDTLKERILSLHDSVSSLSGDIANLEGEMANKASLNASYTKEESDNRYLKEIPSDYAKLEDIPNVDNLVTEAEVDSKIADIEIPSLDGYVKTEDMPTKLSEFDNDEGFITELPDLTVYAEKTDIPTKLSDLEQDITYLEEHQSLDNYYTKNEIENWHKEFTHRLNECVTVDDLSEEIASIDRSGYLMKNEATQLYQPKGDYLTKHQDISQLATKKELEGYQPKGNYLTQHQSLEGYVKTVDADSKYQPKGDYLTEHQSLLGYAKLEDIPTVPTNISSFTNDKDYITLPQSDNRYAKLEDIPTVPKNLSDLKQDILYLTQNDLKGYAKQSYINTFIDNIYDKTDVDALVNHLEGKFDNYYNKLETENLVRVFVQNMTEPDLGAYLKILDADNKYLTQDSLRGYVTYKEGDNRYLTEHSLCNYYDKNEIDAKLDDIQTEGVSGEINLTSYLRKTEAENLYVKKSELSSLTTVEPLTEDEIRSIL